MDTGRESAGPRSSLPEVTLCSSGSQEGKGAGPGADTLLRNKERSRDQYVAWAMSLGTRQGWLLLQLQYFVCIRKTLWSPKVIFAF